MIISVVIPCRNEVNFIQETIDAIFSCKLPENFEIKVLVVDGMSDDGTRERVLDLKSKYSNLFLLDNQKQLTPFAFNIGIHFEKSDFIQIVGARHVLSENYIFEAIKSIQNNPDIWCVGGKILNEYTNELSKLISLSMSTSFGMGLGNFRTIEKSSFTDTVTSPLYPNHVFEKIGYFDQNLVRNQDDDFNYRVTKAGGKILLNADISLKYYVRANMHGLWRQFFQYGYWKVFVNKKHKAITTFRQLIPPLFVLYCCLIPLTLFLGWNIFILSCFPFVLYILVSILFSLKLTRNLNEFSKIFTVFPVLHFSYGFGYIKGMLDFLIMNKKPDKKQQRLSR